LPALLFLGLVLVFPPASGGQPASVDYAAVDAIFSAHCLDCHGSTDPEGQLVLESFETLMKGGEIGPAVVPGKSVESLVVQMIEGRFEKDGKRKIMPPGKRAKLTPVQIASIKAWIDAGAPGPATVATPKELVVPKISPKGPARNPINALAGSPDATLIAVARYGQVELRSVTDLALARTLPGHRGNVNALLFTTNGQELFAAGGQPGLAGEVRQWNVSDGRLIRVFEGHKDAIYSVALSPDGKLLATGSYDQKIKFWDVETGKDLKTLSGHNGCVYRLAFRPDGRILASASADRTVKLWDVTSGERRDTLSQSLKELYALAFSPDGKRLVAGGADNRIRAWDISQSAAETTNPILYSKFAHEGAILNLVFSSDGKTLLSSADDRTVKLWDADEMQERLLLEKQPDWAPALAFVSEATIVVGRLDGSIGIYEVATGKPIASLEPNATTPPSPIGRESAEVRVAAGAATNSLKFAAGKSTQVEEPKPIGKPDIFQMEPRGIQRGIPAKLKLVGTNLLGLTELKLRHAGLKGELLEEPAATTNQVWIQVTAAVNLPRGAYEISVKNTNAESGKLKLYVDDLPQAYETELERNPSGRGAFHSVPDLSHPSPKPETPLLKLPVSFWGALDPAGDTDEIEFEAKAGDSVILDLEAKSIGSKASAMLTLFDDKGTWLASNNGFDGGDPLLNFRIPASGHYRVRISDKMDAGSKDHFYRLSIGSFPVVVGCFPLGVPAEKETEVELLGLNLPPKSAVRLKAGAKGEMEVPIDPEKFRSRRVFKVVVNDGPEWVETEPNDTPEQAMKIPFPVTVDGRIWPANSAPSNDGSGPSADVDLFRFQASAGQTLVIETDAARRGSPLDTKIEVLHADGRPVQRLLLQAVRDSHLTFRAIDSNTDDARVENWQEMELNQFLYLQGEVCKIFRMPQGPDSGFQFYNFQGKRRDYFDTSPVAHALDEPAYIIEPHPPGTKLVANGLPVFTLDYANDDDGERKLGADSRLLFTAPADGSYLMRVTDTRGHSGQRFAYRLTVREAKPDFKVTLNGADPSINAGGGKEFSLTADRLDGFDGDIKVDIDGLPPGFNVSTPLVIQAGHLEAKGTLNAALDAPQPSDTNAALSTVTASAMIDGQPVTKHVNNLGKIKLGEKPKLFVALEPFEENATNFVERSPADKPLEITIAPGQSVPAWLKIKRNGHDDLVTFTVEDLPHGVIVDNIGLNGVLIPKGQDQRKIFLTAAKWVPQVDRLCFAQAKQAGDQTSLALLLHVLKPTGNQTATARH